METVSIGRLTDDFILSGDPVVVTAVPNSFTVGSTFRQVVIRVYCETYNIPSADNKTYEFIVSATGNGKEVVVDISSALRSALAGWEYSVKDVANGKSITYPYLKFYVEAHEREMKENGEVENYPSTKEPADIEIPSEDETVETLSDELTDNPEEEEVAAFNAYLGRVGEYARWNGVKPDGSKFSNKPSGEVFAASQLVSSTMLDGESVKSTFSVVSGGDIDNRERKVFLFVNSYGVFETVSVLTREALSYNVSSSRHALSQSPSYTPKPSISAYKQGGGAVWQMSSGYVNKEWAEWFATEFLMARHYWMQHDGKWLPVVVEPDGDTVMVVDRNDSSLMSVGFTVRAAVSGCVR